MSAEPRIYYFLGNITSHILHALPLQKELGGTFIVLSEKAKREVEKYNVPVITINNKPRRWTRFGYKIKPVFHYLKIDNDLKKTSDFLNKNADVVVFYELYDFSPSVRLTTPKTVFLTHGNMLKDYMAGANRLQVLEQYDYMAALGPYLKKEFVDKNGISPNKLVDIGIARTDEIVKNRGSIVVPKSLLESGDIDPTKPIVSYLPTYWGASSIYTVGKEIVRNFPDNYTLLFRPHPQTPAKLLQEYFDIIATKPGNIIYAPEGKYKNLGLIETFEASSAIIGDVSSVMLEAILTDKPLIFAYDTGANQQDASDYASISDVVEHSQKITTENAKKIADILSISISQGIDRFIWTQATERNFFDSDGTSVESIASFIKNLSKESS
ncbi:MAG: CDP-glycerol glycerophosphotransferase family protein [Candidatus Saccharibacteria bacterium]|nr:MAG: CDP-glycerol glycerophosphotransferase family protein [Candidatus Saccharibacteria bacterium]